MTKYLTYSKQRQMLELTPQMTLLTGETLSTDIRLVGGVFDLKLSVTSEQYNRLLSACIEGAYAAFPDDYNNVIAPLILAGKRLAMSCDDVANCIETDETVQDAIITQNTNSNDLYGNLNPDYLSPDGTESAIMDYRFPPTARNQNAATLDACNLDELWAGIYFMVEQLDITGRDWLEFFVSGADKWQRAANLVSKIPIFGSLAGTALEQLSEVAQDVLNLYDAYSTEAVLQDIACDLFEMVCDECRYPTFQEIIDYYRQNSTITTENVAEISLKALADFLFGSALATAQLCYHTVIMVCLWTLYIGSTFVGMRGAKWITIWLDNGEEYANDAWMVLCDGCGDVHYYYEHDFTTGTMDSWLTDTGAAAVGVGVGDVVGGSLKFSNAWRVFDASLDVFRVEIEFSRSGGNGSGGNQNKVLSTAGTTPGSFPSPTNYISESFAPNESPGLRCNSTVEGLSQRQFLLQIVGAPNSASVHIRKIKIWSTTPATGFNAVSGTIPEC